MIKPEIVKLSDLDRLAERVLIELRPGAAAAVLGLEGDLGAGKTTFTQALARTLGIEAVPRSPTFVLMQAYQTRHVAWPRLIHIDAYRLDSPEELTKLGWAELLSDPANLIVVEWPERVGAILPADHRRLKFAHLNETDREISWLK